MNTDLVRYFVTAHGVCDKALQTSAGAGLQPGPDVYDKAVVYPAVQRIRLICYKPMIQSTRLNQQK